MREWSLTGEDPYSLFLCADARLCVPTYTDDQIWELTLHGTDPPAIGLETTYGRRAHSMRIFPSFFIQGAVLSDPRSFAEPVVIRRFLVSYVRLECHPTPDLRVEAEYWVADSQRVAGRITLVNQGRQARELRLRMQAVLRAHAYETEDRRAPGGGRVVTGGMRADSVSGVTVLTGTVENLAPVLFLTGGARTEVGPYPGLGVDLRLSPGESRGLVWAHAALRELDESFQSARELVGCSWDAEIARVEMVNASAVEIRTGEPDWDAAFAVTQNVSLAAYLGQTRYLPHPSFVEARVPDRGFSARQDGKDYSWHWAGQAIGQAYVNLPQILFAAPDLAKGVLLNFLKSQTSDGSIDWKPGLGGQRNGMLCTPLLSSLTWHVYQHTRDISLLVRSLEPLLAFFERWFATDHDRDRDGLPEWDNTMQAGYDDWPTFVRWRTWGQGLDITKAETTDLAAYLTKECRALIQMAEVLGRKDVAPGLESRLEALREAVERTWSETDASYHHQDRDIHQTAGGELLGRGRGEFVMHVDRTFDPSARLLVRVGASEGVSHAIQVLIHGRGVDGSVRTERLTERSFQWFWDYGTATSDHTHGFVERIEVRGLSPEFETELRIADFTRQDLSLLLPLWAGIPEAERADRLVRRTVLDPERYWRSFGVPMCSAADLAYDATDTAGSGGVRMLWNVMIAEGLLEYGYTAQAVDLLSRVMQGCIQSLKSDKAIYEAYSPDEPHGLGERNHIAGVAPLSLFLEILGVELFSPHKVLLRGRNPFAWPVVVSWMGLEVVREAERTLVTFPDGQSVVVDGDATRLVEQSQEPGEARVL